MPETPAPFRLASIEGHPRAMAALTSAIAQERIPNAWLFAGPKGVGKATAALAVAAAVNCGASDGGQVGLFGGAPPAPKAGADACGICASCRKIAAGNHPDVRVIRVPPDKRLIPIEAVREAIAELAFRPYEGKRRIVIVDGAEALTPQAGNALLKTLEEPPPHSTWILVTSRVSQLLPTVISRCRNIRFGALDPQVAAGIISRQDSKGRLGPGEALSVARLLSGSVGRALGEESRHFSRAMRESVIGEALAAVKAGGNRLIEVAETWNKRDKEEELPLPAALESLALWLRDLAVWRATGEESRLLHADLLAQVKAPAESASDAAIARAFDAVRTAELDLIGNVNDRLTVETLLFALRKELST